jgi:hypothetical protein
MKYATLYDGGEVHLLDGARTACGLGLRLARAVTRHVGPVTCPGCLTGRPLDATPPVRRTVAVGRRNWDGGSVRLLATGEEAPCQPAGARPTQRRGA